jgi:hypothetical protein
MLAAMLMMFYLLALQDLHGQCSRAPLNDSTGSESRCSGLL